MVIGSTGTSSKSELTSPRVLALLGGTSPAAFACQHVESPDIIAVWKRCDRGVRGVRDEHVYARPTTPTMPPPSDVYPVRRKTRHKSTRCTTPTSRRVSTISERLPKAMRTGVCGGSRERGQESNAGIMAAKNAYGATNRVSLLGIFSTQFIVSFVELPAQTACSRVSPR